ncbi:MAG TPA: hypothetical protein VJ044_02225, partial [Candidatus Hodarchaeales archaeon]|nr:hypothetical protein [Candidatus Hodarchaeales archaeon]
ESGKWYTTEAVRFPDRTYVMDPISALKLALKEHLGDRLNEMTAVCLKPYCKYGFPLMVRDWVSFDEMVLDCSSKNNISSK